MKMEMEKQEVEGGNKITNNNNNNKSIKQHNPHNTNPIVGI